MRSPSISSRLLDWLPLPAIFLAYQLAGWVARLLARPSADRALFEWDRWLFGTDPGVWLAQNLPWAALTLFDLFYFSYYVLMPLAPWLLYVRQGRRALWHCWTTLGVAFLICDFLFPWFPSTPPRLLFPAFAYGGLPQTVNLWILDSFSIHGNVFPSSHVAAAATFAFCHLRYHRLGWLFLAWAAGLGISTVSGGYHYGVDAVGGVVVAAAADAAGSKIFERLKAAARS